MNMAKFIWSNRCGSSHPQDSYATVSNALADIGSDSNAFTTWDETLHLTLAPRRNIRTLRAIEAAGLKNLLAGVAVDKSELEKSVIVNALLERTIGMGSP